jgi:thiamine-monophosphate kinase
MPKLGEFELIERYFHREAAPKGLKLGIGDDAAIIEASGPMVVAVDTIVAGIHFPSGHAPDAIGHRALAINLSDVAAMGAEPRWATLALTLPEADSDWLEGFAEGFFALADRFGVALIGGDTTRGALTVTVQVLGDAPAAPLERAGGRVGDAIFVSGTLGDSAAAVELLGRAPPDTSAAGARLIERFSYPEPRVALGRALASVAHAAIDVSDGLMADLGHICEASRCGAKIDIAALPLSPELESALGPERAATLALGGGDDYELCFTAAPEQRPAIRRIARELGLAVSEIGRLVDGDGLTVLRNGVPMAAPAPGYRHF